jgi:hypothetical protein
VIVIILFDAIKMSGSSSAGSLRLEVGHFLNTA